MSGTNPSTNVIARVSGIPIQLGGEQHRGWLPPGAAIPLPTPISHVVMSFEIQADSDSVLLIGLSPDGSVEFDCWYRSSDEAEMAASAQFGISYDQWERLVT